MTLQPTKREKHRNYGTITQRREKRDDGKNRHPVLTFSQPIEIEALNGYNMPIENKMFSIFHRRVPPCKKVNRE